MATEMPYWLQDGIIFQGAEEESSSDEHNDDEANDEDENDDSDEQEAGQDDQHSDSDGNVDGLKRALQEERRKNRDNERKLKKLEREQNRKKGAEENELKQTQSDLEESNKRLTALSDGFRKMKLDAAIEKAARKARFRDTDDALAMVDRNLITVDQDEDNPSDVDIDTKSVEEAVKKLATAKKHLIATGTDDGDRSGSQFGTKGGKKKTTEDEYRQKYSAL